MIFTILVYHAIDAKDCIVMPGIIDIHTDALETGDQSTAQSGYADSGGF